MNVAEPSIRGCGWKVSREEEVVLCSDVRLYTKTFDNGLSADC